MHVMAARYEVYGEGRTIRSPSNLVLHFNTAGWPRIAETFRGQVASKYGLLIAIGVPPIPLLASTL